MCEFRTRLFVEKVNTILDDDEGFSSWERRFAPACVLHGLILDAIVAMLGGTMPAKTALSATVIESYHHP